MLNIKRFDVNPKDMPPLWPYRSFHNTMDLLRRNLSDAHQVSGEYSYVFKPDLPGPHMVLDFRTDGSWGARDTGSEVIDMKMKKWIEANAEGLQQTSIRIRGKGLNYSIYGKMRKLDSVEMFCVYFVLVNGLVIYTEEGLSTLLLQESSDLDMWYIVKPSQAIGINIIVASPTINHTALTNLKEGSKVIGIPVSDDNTDTTHEGMFFALACSYAKTTNRFLG